MREVARRAGVSHQAPYHYFADRESILAALVQEGFQLLKASMEKEMAGAATRAAAIRAIGVAYVAFALDHAAHFQLMFRSDLVRLDRHPGAKACAEEAFQLVIDVVSRAWSRPGAPDDEPTRLARTIACWSMAHGLADLLLAGKLDRHYGEGDPHRRDAAGAVIAAYVEMVVAGLPADGRESL